MIRSRGLLYESGLCCARTLSTPATSACGLRERRPSGRRGAPPTLTDRRQPGCFGSSYSPLKRLLGPVRAGTACAASGEAIAAAVPRKPRREMQSREAASPPTRESSATVTASIFAVGVGLLEGRRLRHLPEVGLPRTDSSAKAMAPRSSARQPAGSAETAPVRKRIRSLTSVADVPVATASESSKPESAPAAAPRRGRSSSSTVAATDDTTARAEPQEAVTGLGIAPEPEEAHVADVATDGLSAYELERLESIRRNNQVLAELGLLDASASLRETSTTRRAAAASRGIKPKRERAVTAELPRRSMRSRNLAPDATTAGVKTRTPTHTNTRRRCEDTHTHPHPTQV
eukprot:scaffold34422_cov101-Isochrysis_galbana.AAC.1